MSVWRKLKAFWAHAFAIPHDELTPEELALLDKIAAGVARRGLAAPAVLFLESVRPMNYVGSQVLVGLAPFIELVVAPEEFDRLAKVLEKRPSIDTLISKIEAHERTRSDSGDGLREHNDQSHSHPEAGG